MSCEFSEYPGVARAGTRSLLLRESTAQNIKEEKGREKRKTHNTAARVPSRASTPRSGTELTVPGYAQRAPAPGQPEAVGSILLRLLEEAAEGIDQSTAFDLRWLVDDLRRGATERAA